MYGTGTTFTLKKNGNFSWSLAVWVLRIYYPQPLIINNAHLLPTAVPTTPTTTMASGETEALAGVGAPRQQATTTTSEWATSIEDGLGASVDACARTRDQMGHGWRGWGRILDAPAHTFFQASWIGNFSRSLAVWVLRIYYLRPLIINNAHLLLKKKWLPEATHTCVVRSN